MSRLEVTHPVYTLSRWLQTILSKTSTYVINRMPLWKGRRRDMKNNMTESCQRD